MNLAVDIGNTRIKMGVFEGTALKDARSFDTLAQESMDYLSAFSIEHVIVSSVRDEEVKVEFGQSGSAMFFDTETSVPLRSLYRTPATMGKDRLAGAVGAHSLFPNDHVCVIDAGTCITYDVVRKDGVYVGGNISPGLEMRFSAMNQFTARLPRVDRRDVERLLGLSTEEALQNGGLIGVLMEIAGYAEVLKSKFGSLVKILTGGDAEYFAERLKTEIFVRPNLVLIGLNEILLSHVAKAN